MTEEQIMKALEYHRTTMENHCNECPYKGRLSSIALPSDTLDLIKRQKAEIENLNVELVGMRGACESYKIHYDNAQAEIERLNGISDRLNDICTNQDLEIERLQIRNKTLTEITKNYDWKFEKSKTEAIKEFAEKFKKKAGSIVTSCQGYEIYETKQYQISAVDFDNLVKEMMEQ